MDGTSILSARDLGHAYGSIVALHSVDFDIPSGRIGLVGANGAGKTTLIKILLGILQPTVGTATVLGHDVAAETLELRSRVGYMPEDDCLPLDVNAAGFLVHAAGLAGLPRDAARQRASDVLTLVGLEEERFRRIGGFSTGMRQRTKLAQAIVHDPELVFLDEPTAGLDPEGREEMLDLISRLGGFGINVLVSSHVLGDIERTCDRVLMLDGGRVLESGELSHFVDEGVVEVETVDDPDEFVRHLVGTGARVESAGAHVRVSTERGDPFDLVRDALAATGTGIRSMGPKSTSLEDVFLGRSGS
ncbi:MAG: ABC transporter ATP-binding protein [Actinomycetota bacterium]